MIVCFILITKKTYSTTKQLFFQYIYASGIKLTLTFERREQCTTGTRISNSWREFTVFCASESFPRRFPGSAMDGEAISTVLSHENTLDSLHIACFITIIFLKQTVIAKTTTLPIIIQFQKSVFILHSWTGKNHRTNHRMRYIWELYGLSQAQLISRNIYNLILSEISTPFAIKKHLT